MQRPRPPFVRARVSEKKKSLFHHRRLGGTNEDKCHFFAAAILPRI